MAQCSICKSEMLKAKSCVYKYAILEIVSVLKGKENHKTFTRERYSNEEKTRCGDCGVLPGGFHHYGCDMERCPNCKGQFAFCDCNFTKLSKY